MKIPDTMHHIIQMLSLILIRNLMFNPYPLCDFDVVNLEENIIKSN